MLSLQKRTRTLGYINQAEDGGWAEDKQNYGT